MSRQDEYTVEEWERLEEYREDELEPSTKAEIEDALLEQQEGYLQEERWRREGPNTGQPRRNDTRADV